MWLFLNNAMVSAVAHRTKPDSLMVRARIAGDLERFFHPMKVDVERTPNADYAYRCTVTREDFATALGGALEGVTYPNFKGSVRGAAGNQSAYQVSQRAQAYGETWDAMFEAQTSLEPDTGRGAW